jgi:hypothetical protein
MVPVATRERNGNTFMRDWPGDAVDAVRRLAQANAALREENAQLRAALSSRILIEQAKGVLAERHGVSLDDAFAALRRGARSSNRKLHDVAREIVTASPTPATVTRELERIEQAGATR